jgi:hypothetical protein
MMHPNPVQRFLGLPAGSDSPFALLGVSPGACDEYTVRDALRRRMDRIRRHPESLSHEADEVRLALHAAAAQLLDPVVRDHLAAIERGAAPSEDLDALHASFREAAAHVLGRAGGWNRESRHWLGLLAHAHGVGDHELHDELRAIVRGARASSPTSRAVRRSGTPSASQQATSVYESIHARPRRRRSFGTPLWTVLSVTTGAVLIGALLIHEATPRRDPPSVQRESDDETMPPAPGELQTSDSLGENANAAPAEQVRARLNSPEVILRWLEHAGVELATNPGNASWRFERAVESLREQWMTCSQSALAQAQQRVLSFFQQADWETPSGERAFEAVARPYTSMGTQEGMSVGDVSAAIWSGATLAQMANEPNLDSAVRTMASNAFREASSISTPVVRSFENAAEFVLPVVGDHLAAHHAAQHAEAWTDQWRTWKRAVFIALDASDDSQAARHADRIVLGAAESLLTSGASVARQVAARDALDVLLSAVRWNAQGDESPPSWDTVLAWFDEPAIATPELAVVTEWIVARSGAPNVAPDMTLNRGSIVESRVALRERYARSWGADIAADSKGFAAVWARTVRDAIRAQDASSAMEQASLMALVARMNAAASLRWRGDVNGASAIVVNPGSPVVDAMRPQPASLNAVRDVNRTQDGAWAVQYLGSRSRDVETKTQLLATLGRTSRALGPIDADVLVSIALQNPSNTPRTRAQQIVRRRAAEAGIISALLERISDAPKNASTTALIREITGRNVPPPVSESWDQAIRYALVDRLLELLEPNDEWSTFDALETVVADAYAQRAGPRQPNASLGFGDEQDADADGPPSTTAYGAAADVWYEWREQASALAPNSRAPVSFREMERRRQGRLRLAGGPLQRFVADQISIAEAMAFVVTAERPSRAQSVGALMRQFSLEVSEAPNIIAQSLAAERVMLTLWAIRFGLTPDDVSQVIVETETATRDSNAASLDLESIDEAWLSQSPVHDVETRLRALSPDDPIAAFELAEELAYESQAPQGRDLARRLYQLALQWDEADGNADLGASVYLALADLSTRADERRWMIAMALSLDPTLARIVTLPDQERASLETRVNLAAGLELYRLGEYGDAQRRLHAPGVRELLEEYENMITGHTAPMLARVQGSPSCRECRNARVIPDPRDPGESRLCLTCAGDPGPDLPDEELIRFLRLERAILADEPSSWSADLMMTRGDALRGVG